MKYDLTKTPIYYDSICGLVKCKLLSINSDGTASIKITDRSNFIFQCSQLVVTAVPLLVPRTSVRRKRGSLHVLPFSWSY